MGDDMVETQCGFLVPTDHLVKRTAELYGKMTTINFNSKAWDYRVEVIEVAKAVFGRRLDGFCASQFEGKRLHGYRLDFLKETLSYIESGKRTVSVGNWYELLLDYPLRDDRPLPKRVDSVQQLSTFKHVLTNPDYIAQWCSHEKGFEDMLCTLAIVAGVMRSTN